MCVIAAIKPTFCINIFPLNINLVFWDKKSKKSNLKIIFLYILIIWKVRWKMLAEI